MLLAAIIGCTSSAYYLRHSDVVHERHWLKMLPFCGETFLVQDLAMHEIVVVVLHLTPDRLQFNCSGRGMWNVFVKETGS